MMTTVDVAIFDLKNWYNLSSRASFVMPEKEGIQPLMGTRN